MKLFYLCFLFALVSCSKNESKLMSFKESENLTKIIMDSMNVGDCFRTEYTVEGKPYNFRKTYFYKDNIHVVMAKAEVVVGAAIKAGDYALLVAQPDPECVFSSEDSHKCKYWFRTVESGQPFLFNRFVKKIACPQELSLDQMIKKLEASDDSIKYNLDVIKRVK